MILPIININYIIKYYICKKTHLKKHLFIVFGEIVWKVQKNDIIFALADGQKKSVPNTRRKR